MPVKPDDQSKESSFLALPPFKGALESESTVSLKIKATQIK